MKRRELLTKFGLGAAVLPFTPLLAKRLVASEPVASEPVASEPKHVWIRSSATVMGVDQRGLDLYYHIDSPICGAGEPIKGRVRDFRELDTLMREYQVHHCVIDACPATLEASNFAKRFTGYVTLSKWRNLGADKPFVEIRGYIVANGAPFSVPLVSVDPSYYRGVSYDLNHDEILCRVARELFLNKEKT